MRFREMMSQMDDDDTPQIEPITDMPTLVRKHVTTNMKWYWTAGAVVVVGLVIASLWGFSGQGDMKVVRQRLMGEVKLSTGKYSAKSLAELNQLSWDHGLDMLETLDGLNSCIKRLEKLQQNPNVSAEEIRKAEGDVQREAAKVNQLLADRKVLQETARVFKSDSLYTPVYQEYLTDTMNKLSLLNLAQSATPKGHEVQ